MPEPCPRCGVRSDVGCSHKPPEGSAPVQIGTVDHRRDPGRYAGNGQNFRRAKPPGFILAGSISTKVPGQ